MVICQPPIVNGGGDSLWKWSNFRLSRAHDLDLGSGHTAYCYASLVDLYLHSKFGWNQRNFFWTDGRTYRRTDIWDPLMLWYWNWKISTTYANHVFHADTDLAVAVESSVEADDVRRVALVKHHQLTNDLITHSRFDLQMYQLQDHTTKLTTVINNVYVRWQLRNFFILIYAVLTRVVTTNEISLPAPNQHRHRGVLQCSRRSFWTLFPENCPALP